MHLLFGIVLIILAIWLVWETLVLVALLIQLAWQIIVLLFLIAGLPFAACVDLWRYLKRRRLANAVGPEVVAIAVEDE